MLKIVQKSLSVCVSHSSLNEQGRYQSVICSIVSTMTSAEVIPESTVPYGALKKSLIHAVIEYPNTNYYELVMKERQVHAGRSFEMILCLEKMGSVNELFCECRVMRSCIGRHLGPTRCFWRLLKECVSDSLASWEKRAKKGSDAGYSEFGVLNLMEQSINIYFRRAELKSNVEKLKFLRKKCSRCK